jgi:hypothetical protein
MYADHCLFQHLMVTHRFSSRFRNHKATCCFSNHPSTQNCHQDACHLPVSRSELIKFCRHRGLRRFCGVHKKRRAEHKETQNYPVFSPVLRLNFADEPVLKTGLKIKEIKSPVLQCYRQCSDRFTVSFSALSDSRSQTMPLRDGRQTIPPLG